MRKKKVQEKVRKSKSTKPNNVKTSGTKRTEVKGNRPSHYVDKDILLQEIIKSQKDNKVSDELSLMFGKIIEGVSHRFPNLLYYGIIDDVKQDCHLLLLQKFQNFKAKKKTSCFAYFTTIIYNQMRYQLTKARRHKENRDHMVKSVIDYLEVNKTHFLDDDAEDEQNNSIWKD